MISLLREPQSSVPGACCYQSSWCKWQCSWVCIRTRSIFMWEREAWTSKYLHGFWSNLFLSNFWVIRCERKGCSFFLTFRLIVIPKICVYVLAKYKYSFKIYLRSCSLVDLSIHGHICFIFYFLSFKVKVCQYPEEISKAFKLPLFPVFLMELITL